MDLDQLQLKVKLQLLCNISEDFGAGFFIKKEPALSSFNYMLYVKILWFKIALGIQYGNKL